MEGMRQADLISTAASAKAATAAKAALTRGPAAVAFSVAPLARGSISKAPRGAVVKAPGWPADTDRASAQSTNEHVTA